MFERIKALYEKSKISSKGVAKAVADKLITQEQYYMIVGEDEESEGEENADT